MKMLKDTIFKTQFVKNSHVTIIHICIVMYVNLSYPYQKRTARNISVLCIFSKTTSQMYNLPSGSFPEVRFANRGPSAVTRTLKSCRWRNYIFGKLPLDNIPLEIPNINILDLHIKKNLNFPFYCSFLIKHKCK